MVTVRTVPPGSLKTSTFCPHSVFMCFAWVSEQTAFISLYSINLLVFITETERVYCAVRTKPIIEIRANCLLTRSSVTSRAVSRWPLTAEGRVRSQVCPCEIYGSGQSGTATSFSPSTSGFSSQYLYTDDPHPSASARCSCQQDKRSKPGNPPKAELFWKSVSTGHESTYFHSSSPRGSQNRG